MHRSGDGNDRSSGRALSCANEKSRVKQSRLASEPRTGHFSVVATCWRASRREVKESTTPSRGSRRAALRAMRPRASAKFIEAQRSFAGLLASRLSSPRSVLSSGGELGVEIDPWAAAARPASQASAMALARATASACAWRSSEPGSPASCSRKGDGGAMSCGFAGRSRMGRSGVPRSSSACDTLKAWSCAPWTRVVCSRPS